MRINLKKKCAEQIFQLPVLNYILTEVFLLFCYVYFFTVAENKKAVFIQLFFKKRKYKTLMNFNFNKRNANVFLLFIYIEN